MITDKIAFKSSVGNNCITTNETIGYLVILVIHINQYTIHSWANIVKTQKIVDSTIFNVSNLNKYERTKAIKQ